MVRQYGYIHDGDEKKNLLHTIKISTLNLLTLFIIYKLSYYKIIIRSTINTQKDLDHGALSTPSPSSNS